MYTELLRVDMNIDESGETASDSVNTGFPVVRIVRDI